MIDLRTVEFPQEYRGLSYEDASKEAERIMWQVTTRAKRWTEVLDRLIILRLIMDEHRERGEREAKTALDRAEAGAQKGAPNCDWASHSADALRYAFEGARTAKASEPKALELKVGDVTYLRSAPLGSHMTVTAVHAPAAGSASVIWWNNEQLLRDTLPSAALAKVITSKDTEAKY